MSDNARTVLGVLGHPVSHSQSPELFGRMLQSEGRTDVDYRTFDLPNIEDFPAFLERHPQLAGLNVTVPHKQTIVPFLHGMSKKPSVWAPSTRWSKRTKDGSDTTPTFGDSNGPFNPSSETATNAHLCLARVEVQRQCTTFWLVWA